MPDFIIPELLPEITFEKVVFVLLMLNVRVAPLPRAAVPPKIKSPVPPTLKRMFAPAKRRELLIVLVVLSLLFIKLSVLVPVFEIVKVPVPTGPLVTAPGPPVEFTPRLTMPPALDDPH